MTDQPDEVSQAADYPIGASITEDELFRDPYRQYAKLHADEPVSWIADLNMWYVVKYNHVTEILMDSDRFTTAFDRSTVRDTFGDQMLSVEGPLHHKYRKSMRGSFRPKAVRDNAVAGIRANADELINAFSGQGETELRTSFASILPVLTMLSTFGLPRSDFDKLRGWYSSFEASLANFKWDEAIRRRGHEAVAAFHDYMQSAIERAMAGEIPDSLLASLVSQTPDTRLSDEEIRLNALIVFFGGISTVEALILNSVWMIGTHPQVHGRLGEDPSLLPRIIDEVARWRSPVQSAIRHVTRDFEFHGHMFREGEVVCCMLGAANRDPAIFPDADKVNIDRPREQKHLAFAQGPHMCLGMHLALTEARIAVERLYERLPGLKIKMDKSPEPVGYEFHQPEALYIGWKPSV